MLQVDKQLANRIIELKLLLLLLLTVNKCHSTKHVVCRAAYHARDKGQGACLVSHWDKVVASRKIPAEADVCCNCLSFSDGGLGLAFAIDGGLYETEHISIFCISLITVYVSA